MRNNYYILGVEASCDDTSICLMNKQEIVVEKTISSAPIQKEYGGVVPEIASREHLNNIHLIFEDILKQAKISAFDLNVIVYTKFPGLSGSLHVSEVFVQTLASVLKIELIGINHLYGHIFSVFINQEEKIKFPFLSLVASGGNTILYLVNSLTNIIELNHCADDAVGEVFDKVAKGLGWGYPGGPVIDKNYDVSKANIKFINNTNYESDKPFSFSGLKTAVLNYINSSKMKKVFIDPVAIASSFQKEAIKNLVDKINFYANKEKISFITIGGGVSANSLLRSEVLSRWPNALFAPLKYTGDNATMIAFYGFLILRENNKC